ncbi:MAG: hypothetical protein JNL65_11490 [Saprospiraceae bacterium]|nr:hypothetical protein [Saprospiraceae bacterium]
MKYFNLHQNCVEIVQDEGSIFTIYFNERSGKVYFRYKIEAIYKIKHPGIYLGTDKFGNGYFLHNHPHYGKAHIVSEKEFSKDSQIYFYSEKCSNNPIEVIEIGLNEVLRGECYKPITWNCQTYANTACHNQRSSEDVGKVILFFLCVFGFRLALSKRK